MKFLQVHTIYDGYLDEFYQRHPELLNAPSTTHEQALLNEAVGAVHMFAPALRNLGYDAHLVIANNLFAQYQWASEHGVTLQKALRRACDKGFITATDLASLYIPNFVIHLGLSIALLAAVYSGQLQIEHLWQPPV